MKLNKNNLIRLYSEQNRFYHNLKHIEDCIKEFELVKKSAQNSEAVETAIWYHDAIYNPLAKDNEEQSAKLAYNDCIRFGQTRAFAKKVSDLILFTKHNKIPDTIDGKIIVDIDLSVLGKTEKEFNQYEKNIRKEYSWVSEKDFKNGRGKILQDFLNRPFIYHTDFFKQKYEKRARENLQKSLNRLQ